MFQCSQHITLEIGGCFHPLVLGYMSHGVFNAQVERIEYNPDLFQFRSSHSSMLSVGLFCVLRNILVLQKLDDRRL
jgi:hypothetical protein